MLKWLVTRGPTLPPREVTTEDPLATLRVKSRRNVQQVYAVSRVNPLYEDEEGENTGTDEGVEVAKDKTEPEGEEEEEEEREVVREPPESPPTDRGSIQSSGYGSKETDSVSSADVEEESHDPLGDRRTLEELQPPPAFSDPPPPPRVISKEKDGAIIYGKNSTGISGVSQGARKVPSTLDIVDGKPIMPEGGKTVAEIRKSFEGLSLPSKEGTSSTKATINKRAQLLIQNNDYVQSIALGKLGPMRRARSLEVLRSIKPASSFSSKTSTVPRPVWPRVSASLVQNPELQSPSQLSPPPLSGVPRLGLGTETTVAEVHHRRDSLMENPNGVDILRTDSRFVSYIHVTPRRRMTYPSTESSVTKDPQKEVSAEAPTQPTKKTTPSVVPISAGLVATKRIAGNPAYKNLCGDTENDLPVTSNQLDSLVNDEVLRMMHYPRFPNDVPEEDEEDVQEEPIRVTAYLGSQESLYTRGLSTLQKAATIANVTMIKPPQKRRTRKGDRTYPYRSHSAKVQGLSAMKDLWERSGLKTNGRKLIVDVDDVVRHTPDIVDVEDGRRPFRRWSSSSTGSRLESEMSLSSGSATTRSSHTYEDLRRYKKDSTGGNGIERQGGFLGTESPFNEISDGVDNLAFADDDELDGVRTPSPALSPAFRNSYIRSSDVANGTRYLDPKKLAVFQKKISEKVQGAPLHRMQWLDLDEVVIDDSLVDRHERRVTFTDATIIPTTLEREVRTLPLSDKEGQSHKVWATQTYGPLPSFQNAAKGRNDRRSLWSALYGSRSWIGQRVGPHPNRKAPICRVTNDSPNQLCQDFTLDLRCSDKLRQRAVARKRRRKCYTIILIIVAFVVFLGVVVAVSWYSTNGKKFFGPV